MAFDAYLEKLTKQNQETKSLMLDMLFHEYSADQWRGLMAVPEKSILESVLRAFEKNTDIPLELPFFTMLHFISGYLLSKKVKCRGNFGEFYPEIWTIVLANSGSGKTFAHDAIAAESPVKSSFPEPASGAKFIDSLQAHNFGLWFQDEIAQIMKQIDTPRGALADVKSYLLRAYSNSKIERATKKETITIDEPCLGILGLNTPESFFKSIRPESLLDGFAQRFSYVVAQPDEARDVLLDPYKYAHYDLSKIRKVVRTAFDKLQTLKIHPVYVVGMEAEEAYKVAFAALINETLPQSFYRRVMFKSFKYALLYHIILGKESDVIDAEDIGWGARVSNLHLQDLKHLVKRDEAKELELAIKKARKLKENFEASAKPFDARVLQQNTRGLDAKSAKALFSLIGITKKVPKKKVEEFYDAYDHRPQQIYKPPVANTASLDALNASLAAGMDANAKNKDGITPIHYAALHGYSECVETLFKAGANLNETNRLGDAALHIAAEYGDLKTISKLIEFGADVNLDSVGREQTPIVISALNGNYDCVEALLNAGSLIEKMSIDGMPDEQQKACVDHINQYMGEVVISYGEKTD